MSELQSKIANLLIEKHLVKPYEAIDVTFCNARLKEIQENRPLISKNKTNPLIAPTITTTIDHLGFCVPDMEVNKVKENHGTVTAVATEERSMNNEPFIVASRGRNPENPSDRTSGSPTEQRLEPNTKGLCNTLTTVQKDNLVAEPVNPMPDGTCRTIKNQYYKTSQANYERTGSMGATGVNTGLRIRKLTPKECFRLMGFDDEDFYKAEAVNSNKQLYKQAGNSIVVDVLEAIFTNLKPYLSERK